ncbi:aguA [Symbiodinium pilosum]|uniref:AguA protein n=1 Tax=Symbiodinium pilosum TaxID=2952 RepID=A0A812LFM2_SYMPI|nr:aguA [Symbiodinium pilosum]
MGDIARAAEGLDYMIQNNLTVEVHHFNSAINACSKADPPSKSAATFLFKQLCDRDLNTVTYTALVRAHRLAKLEDLSSLRKQMQIRGVQTDRVFAENYVRSLLRGRSIPYAPPRVVALLAETSEDRLREVREAIRDFKRMDCMTALCRPVERALS